MQSVTAFGVFCVLRLGVVGVLLAHEKNSEEKNQQNADDAVFEKKCILHPNKDMVAFANQCAMHDF